jgi:hypothetical protein
LLQKMIEIQQHPGPSLLPSLPPSLPPSAWTSAKPTCE